MKTITTGISFHIAVKPADGIPITLAEKFDSAERAAKRIRAVRSDPEGFEHTFPVLAGYLRRGYKAMVEVCHQKIETTSQFIDVR